MAQDKGGIELGVRWLSTSSDLTRETPSMEIVAVPLSIDNEALAIQGNFLEIQVTSAKVRTKNLDEVTLGVCAGYITVYPGYISKRMEPPTSDVKTYPLEWCTFYTDGDNYFLYARVGDSKLTEDLEYFWGRFG